MKGKTVDALREALSMCGYDLDEIMTNRTHKRIYTDIRSIVWSIYQDELHRTTGQVARAFGWDRTTIYCALVKSKNLRKVDSNYCDMYDAVYGYYMNTQNRATK